MRTDAARSLAQTLLLSLRRLLPLRLDELTREEKIERLLMWISANFRIEAQACPRPWPAPGLQSAHAPRQHAQAPFSASMLLEPLPAAASRRRQVSMQSKLCERASCGAMRCACKAHARRTAPHEDVLK